MALDQTQIKFRQINLHNKAINHAELALMAKQFFDANPNSTQLDASKYFGFKNHSTGVTKISRSMAFLKADTDLFDAVLNEEISFNAATKEMRKRERKRQGKVDFC